MHIQVSETVDPQGVSVEDEDMTEASEPAVQDNGERIIAYLKTQKTNKKKKNIANQNHLDKTFFSTRAVNIQQIAEFSSETYDAVTSMVAMAPGTVAVVQQVKHIRLLTELWEDTKHFKCGSLILSIYLTIVFYVSHVKGNFLLQQIIQFF